LKKIVCAAAAAVALSACATITRGTTNQIQIRSEPSGAQVITSTSQTCMTPCTLTMNRRDEFSVKFSLAGYREAIVEVRTQVAGTGVLGVAGNAIVGGVIGVGVDVVTGSALEHVPNPVIVTLERIHVPSTRLSPPRAPRARASAIVAIPSEPGITPILTPPPPPAPAQLPPGEPIGPGVVPPSM
jgi:PEGA domain